ncbi:MAG: hypothetical protein F9K48_01815 [Candidatus Brocadia sp.]|nr:MAG: hypothetical protein F9K48_01815 [Candidatus Brocadia sp.]
MAFQRNLLTAYFTAFPPGHRGLQGDANPIFKIRRVGKPLNQHIQGTIQKGWHYKSFLEIHPLKIDGFRQYLPKNNRFRVRIAKVGLSLKNVPMNLFISFTPEG